VTYRPRPGHGASNGRSRNGGYGNGAHGNGRNGRSYGGGSGRYGARGNPNLRRLALMRLRAKPRRSGISAVLPAILLMIPLLLMLTVVGTVFAGGGAAAVTVAQLESELPDVANFEDLEFAQPSIVYDRTGTIELARFQDERRRVVTYEEIPRLVLDATIATEDRTFWENEGYDPNAIMAAAIESLADVRDRGASTITQQFVRARLLPRDVLEGDLFERKAKEILQARRLTQAFPGEEGKQRIITAYLNQIYYGHNAYGVAAAAEVYFGIDDLDDLTPAQAALLAGLPQSPSTYDLFKWAEEDSLGRLVVPTRSVAGERLPAPVERRNFILRNLHEGHGRWTRLSAAELDAAINEPIVLEREPPLFYRAPHFIWHLKPELDQLLVDRASAERGGYRIITSLDWNAQQLAEKYITAATIYTQEGPERFRELLEENDLLEDEEWLEFLRGKEIHNGALVALDARRGDILAYVGSAGYYRDDLASDKLKPKFDVAGQAYRAPGSAWKPMVYAAGFDNGTLTPGTLLFDTATEFGKFADGRPYVPRNATLRDYGPTLAREALQFSLNVTAIKALERVGVATVAEMAQRMQLSFPGSDRRLYTAGLAGALGTVEVRMLEFASAFAALGNGGVQSVPRSILEISDSAGQVIYSADEPVQRQVMSEQAAFLVTDIIRGNTDPEVNPVFGPGAAIFNGPNGERRDAAIKTGTTNELRDLSAYGFLAPPADPSAPQLMVGVWMGNSDSSPPSGGDQPAYAATGPGRVWRAFMREYSRGMPLAQFQPPDEGVTRAMIDAWSGGRPGPWTLEQREEWFITGTQPGGPNEVDPPGRLYTQMCDTWFIDPLKVEPGKPEKWQEALQSWLIRARQGTGVRSEHGTLTDYLPGRDSWGREVLPTTCALPSPSPTVPIGPTPPPGPGPTPPPGPGPTPPPGPGPTPKPTPPPGPTPNPTPPPPTPEPTPQPTPEPPPTEPPPPPDDGDGDGGDGDGDEPGAGAGTEP
jgi:membrane peptidoglycan carboxypeptidase